MEEHNKKGGTGMETGTRVFDALVVLQDGIGCAKMEEMRRVRGISECVHN